jgi:hypothetical protein
MRRKQPTRLKPTLRTRIVRASFLAGGHSTLGYAYMKQDKTAAAVTGTESASGLLKGLDDQHTPSRCIVWAMPTPN